MQMHEVRAVLQPLVSHVFVLRSRSYVKDADKMIIGKLKENGRLVQHVTCRHSYPFCWRSETPLIYKVLSPFRLPRSG